MTVGLLGGQSDSRILLSHEVKAFQPHAFQYNIDRPALLTYDLALINRAFATTVRLAA